MARKDRRKKSGRRTFLKIGAVLGGGLVVGAVGGNFWLNKKIKEYSGEGFTGDVINAWVSVKPDNTVMIAMPRSEMGQGVSTALPMLVAEELEVEMSSVEIMQPQPESPYANTGMLTRRSRDLEGMELMEKVYSVLPLVATGGSSAIIDAYDVMRTAGATARVALIKAAAEKWGVEESALMAEKGHVVNKDTKEKLSYGDLASAAAQIKIKELPKLKPASEFKVINTDVPRLDIPAKVNGTAKFGLDTRMEGLAYGAVRHATYRGGEVTGIKNLKVVEGMKGVKKVVLLPKGIGAVVVADNTWRAMNAAKVIKFEETGDSKLSSASIAKQAAEILADDDKMIATPENVGDVSAALSASDKVIEAKYEVPYLAHACMEPLNCTVLVKDGKATTWVGSQGSSIAMDAISASTGIDKENITVNITYLGGGFGRRAEIDFITYAGHVAKEMEGTPIQVVFSREEDMRHDMFRPYVASQFKAVLNDDGAIEAWENKIAVQSVGNSATTRIKPAFAPKPKDDPSSSEGAIHLPYTMTNRKTSFGQINAPVEVGNWRSVGASQNSFFTESFMDECAAAAGKDPYEFRREKITDSRFKAVLDKVAEISNWKGELAENQFRGIALAKSFDSIVAEVAEVTKVGEKEFSIDNFYCVIDCGRTVHPKIVTSQMESGIVYGLTAAMYGEITFKDGEVEQYNFPQYEMMRLQTAPRFKVHIMDVDEYPGGVGEPSTPPAAPALANALFAATGERIRSLPFSKHGYKFV